MKTLSSVYIILTFIINIITSPNQKINKMVYQTDSCAQNIEDDQTIDGFDYLSFAKVFLLQTEQSEVDKVEKYDGKTPQAELLQTEKKYFQLNQTTNSIVENYHSKENNEVSYANEVLPLEISSNQIETNSFSCSSILSPVFNVAFPEKASKEKISEPFSYEYIERDAINSKGIANYTCYKPIINEVSTACSEQVDFFSQEKLSLTRSVEIQTNNTLPFNIHTGKNSKKRDFFSITQEILLYKKTKNIISNVSRIDNFINKIIFEKILNKVNHESAIIIKEELCNLMFTSNFYRDNNRDNYSDVDLDDKNIILYLKNQNSEFYRNEFETNDDLKTILTFGKKLVKFETDFLSNLNSFEWLRKIEEYFSDNLLEKVKNNKINLIVPELNYFFEVSGKNNIDKILRGHVLYVHYIYEIIRLLTCSIFENNESLLKKKSSEEKNKAKTLMNKRIFFMRRLISELFYSFQYDSKKIQIYRLLNLFSCFSSLTNKKATYFRTYLFTMKIRFIFRFIFDSNIKIGEEFKNDLIICILCQLLNRSASKLIQRRLFYLIYNHFCLENYIDNVLALINISRNKFTHRVKNILLSESVKIKNLHKKIYLLNTSQNTQMDDIEIIKIFLELEFRISWLEKSMLGNSFRFMYSLRGKGYKKVFNRILEEAEQYYIISK